MQGEGERREGETEREGVYTVKGKESKTGKGEETSRPLALQYELQSIIEFSNLAGKVGNKSFGRYLFKINE